MSKLEFIENDFYTFGFPEEKKDFRNYVIDYENMNKEEIDKLETIRNTYKLQRTYCNYEHTNKMVNKYCNFNSTANFWSLFYSLDGILDLSDPDTSLPNGLHALQTAEAIRNDGYPDWFILCGLIHDMGKILYLCGNDIDGTSKNTQWALVGDTFITGCDIPDDIILNEYNILNKDHTIISKYNNNCGLNNTCVSFGHDEYMYRMIKANNHTMPIEAEYIIRYHSLYCWHSGTSYDYLMDTTDIVMKPIVKAFNSYDLYTKNDNNILKWNNELKEYYNKLIKKYFNNDNIFKF